MSETDTPDDHGRTVATVTPPVDARARVTVRGEKVTDLDVPADRTLGVHVRRDDHPESLDVTTDSTDDVPDPEFDDDLAPEDAAESVTLSGPSWVTVTVAGVRRLKFNGRPGEVVAVYMAAADDEVAA